jgi:hypothetical protein
MKRMWMLKLGLAITVLLTGLPYWLTPYYKVTLTEWPFPTLWAVVSFIIAAVIENWVHNRPSQTTWWIGSGALIGVFIKIMADSLFIDSLSHKAFLFELGIAYLVGMAGAGMGAYLTSLITTQEKKPTKS